MKRLALLFSFALCAACGDGHDDHHHGDEPDAAASAPDAMQGTLETRTLTFAAGKFIEVQFATGEGDLTILRLDSTEPVTWNVHGHAGGGTTTFDEGVENPVEAEFTAPSTDSFWFLIGNANSGTIEVDIEIELFGDGEIEEWFL